MAACFDLKNRIENDLGASVMVLDREFGKRRQDVNLSKNCSRLHQTLDASRVHRDCVLEVLRGNAANQPLFFTVRPSESAGR